MDRTEHEIADMVIHKRIYAKIDRIKGVVTFKKEKFVNDSLNDWNSDIKSMLRKVETTCHLIHREQVVHGN